MFFVISMFVGLAFGWLGARVARPSDNAGLGALIAFLFGPLGVLDDVVVVAATLSRLVNHVHPDVVRSHWSGQGDALRAVQRVSAWSERNVTGRIRSLLPL